MTDRQLWRRFGCAACRRYRPGDGACEAFPAGIPIEVASGRLPHLAPLRGDRGLQFDRKPAPGGTADE